MLASGITLDLPATPDFDIGGFEIIDLTGAGNNKILLTAADVTAMSDTGTLQIIGNAGDSVRTDTGWTQGADTTIDGVTYGQYGKGAATLQVAAVDQTLVNDSSFVAANPQTSGLEDTFFTPSFENGNVNSGGAGDDILTGTEFADFLDGLGGNDTLTALAGDDSLDGGTGNDTLYGGSGFDFLDGWFGDDVLYGGGNDDSLLGFDGNDALYGGAGSDFLNGEAGDDYLDGGGGIDFMAGGFGDDTLVFDAGGRFGTHGDAGTDTLLVKGSGITVDMPAIPDFEMGGIEIIDLTGTGNNALLLAGADTTIDGVTYNQWGKGTATLQVNAAVDQTNINSSTFTASTPADSGGVDAFFTPDFAEGDVTTGTAGDDTGTDAFDFLDGGDGNDILIGLGGDDTLQGWTGNDILYGGSGFDFLDGWIGDDVLYGNANADTLLGFDGNDALYGGGGPDFLEGESGNDYLDGGAGLDFVNGAAGDDTVVFDPSGTFGAHGGTGADTLAVTGSGIDLNLTAIADFDITGFEVIDLTGTGNNTLSLQLTDVTAMSDTDILTVIGDSGDAIVTPAETWVQGTDTTVSGVTYNVWTKAAGTLYVDTDIDQSQINSSTFVASTPVSSSESFGGILADFGGDSAGSFIEGTESADTLTGTELDDSIFGHGGNDTISGFGGSDYLQGDEGDDVLYGGERRRQPGWLDRQRCPVRRRGRRCAAGLRRRRRAVRRRWFRHPVRRIR